MAEGAADRISRESIPRLWQNWFHWRLNERREQLVKKRLEAEEEYREAERHGGRLRDGEPPPEGPAPTDPVQVMRAECLALRNLYQSFPLRDFQGGMDRLRARWRERFGSERLPPRRTAGTLAEAEEAIDDLLKAMSAGEPLPPEGTTFTEDDAPAAFRDGGKPDGKVLTAPYLADSPDWRLLGPYLSKSRREGKLLTTHIKVGRAMAYLFKELAVLRTIKTQQDVKREDRR